MTLRELIREEGGLQLKIFSSVACDKRTQSLPLSIISRKFSPEIITLDPYKVVNFPKDVLLVSRGTSLVGLRSVRDVQFVLQLERCRVIRIILLWEVFLQCYYLLSTRQVEFCPLEPTNSSIRATRDKKCWMDCSFGIRRRKLNQILIKRRNLFPKKQIYYYLCNLSEITVKILLMSGQQKGKKRE